ncbi:MAG: hypothetical protein HYX38_21065 [Rhodospirillales bacterium]|nr:hypothetical protein [Rhodospirillales bacterium]
MQRSQHNQRDLFEDETSPAKLHPALRVKLTPLLQRLLTEAAGAGVVGDDLGSKGADDDQDHG